MWIKVCGIKDLQTANDIAELEIDAIGLNFYPPSPRFVSAQIAQQISEFLPKKIARVGLFVNHSFEDVISLSSRCRLDFIQLHGDESASFCQQVQQQCQEARLIRAWRMGADGLDDLARYLDECHSLDVKLAGCLIDAHVKGVFGGSGKTINWNDLTRHYRQHEWPSLILAGGLTPSNIAEAISTAKPWGVDVASGVESSPGIKEISLIRNFVSSARTIP